MLAIDAAHQLVLIVHDVRVLHRSLRITPAIRENSAPEPTRRSSQTRCRRQEYPCQNWCASRYTLVRR